MDLVLDEVVRRHGKQLAEGDAIVLQGEPIHQMYIIESGRVRILRRIHGDNVCLAILSAGDFFGEMGEDTQTSSVSAMADTKTTIIAIDSSTFKQILHQNPELAQRIINRFNTRLRQMNDRLIALVQHDGAFRLADTLRFLFEKHKEEQVVLDHLDEESLAHHAGLRPEVARQFIERLIDSQVFCRTNDGRLGIESRSNLDEFILYCELKKRYDPLTLEELGSLAGMNQADVKHLARRVIDKRLQQREKNPRMIRTPLQRYYQLKLRFELLERTTGEP